VGDGRFAVAHAELRRVGEIEVDFAHATGLAAGDTLATPENAKSDSAVRL
jgi:hypothetical protein